MSIVSATTSLRMKCILKNKNVVQIVRTMHCVTDCMRKLKSIITFLHSN